MAVSSTHRRGPARARAGDRGARGSRSFPTPSTRGLRAAAAAPRAADGRPVRAVPRQARAEQGRVAPGRRSPSARGSTGPWWSSATVPSGRALRRRRARSGRDVRVIGWIDQAPTRCVDGARVAADLSFARARVAEPRADRSQRPGRADRRHEHRRHTRHRHRRKTGLLSPRRRSWPPTCGGCAQDERSRRRRSARRARGPRADAFSAASVVIARSSGSTSSCCGRAPRDAGRCASPSSRARSPRCTALGGLERRVLDLVRHLADAAASRSRSSPATPRDARPAADPIAARSTLRLVPYRTFPFAGRRGTTVLDRSTAYPLFGERAGRLAASTCRRGEAVDLVHGFGASVLGYARRARGAVRRAARPQPAGAGGIRRHRSRRGRR